MNTKLLEFQNESNDLVRWIATLPDGEIKKGVICLHGFERSATTEKKFKALSDLLVKDMIATFRFDFSGCWISDWDFKVTTIEKQWNDLLGAIKVFQKEIWDCKIDVVAHSLWACVLSTQLENIKDKIEKIILIAPAVNQRDLLRYWFVTSQMKKNNPNLEITWDNYKDHLDEDAFLKDCSRTDKMTKANYIDSEYFMQSKNHDFSQKFQNIDWNVLHIHGSKDVAVPLESVNIKFSNQVVVENGDHDLEKPNQMNQWLQKWVDFLSK